ncbi:hypothetical protein [Pseudoxanthomonas winnipegensis]|uniref:Lipoprotein n=1 Tax=Pseudoxanthomonas winnipegensis TaxID=2480810 RepID=A0A4Q8LLR9_9GAMM|nr:hypothetical protein [Pseudoxanthomonas winnipegensis]RZZ86361.1 hypothetical protein EA662_10705 [Pseudoxanthomonas winnipegensis]TAA31498.1 hypothetical protein EA661_08010 [Pseudoxanthomonas winnipegensis]TAA41378.1 hypothetical protein EAT51_09955 [Pseudoxanthomonas winnipegensis]TBV77295.1 hypothetical protein EYC46_07685 [Pseudoxanthomonas winnipegensis]
MKWTIVSMLVLLTSCATLDNRYDPAKLSVGGVAPGSGVVVLSTGAQERCISASTFLKVAPAQSPYYVTGIALLPVDSYALKSDFPDHQGNVHALALPAGKYYLAPWVANPMLKAVKIPKAEFSVNAGEVVYLGEYFMPVACSWSTQSKFFNRFNRDIDLITAKNPSIDRSKVVVRIGGFTGLAIGNPNP